GGSASGEYVCVPEVPGGVRGAALMDGKLIRIPAIGVEYGEKFISLFKEE
ncbi:hypothetical protein GWI33_008476, partial [Rhynchophorus ferrugineus]